MPTDAGRVVTVDGSIAPKELGPTLPHEHLFIDLVEAWFDQPDTVLERSISDEPVSLSNFHYLRRNPLDNKDNPKLDSFEEAVEAVDRFYEAGGKSIVDVTPKNVGGDPEAVRRVSRATGVTIVHGTSYYTEAGHPPSTQTASIEDLTKEFVSDVQEGIDDTDVRAGLVGEIGISGTIHENEEKVLRAGARAAAKTGAALNIHPNGRKPEAHQDYTRPSSQWALELVDIIEEEGLTPDRVIMSHMDRTRFELEADSLEYQRKLADRGCYVEYDLWGMEFFQEKFMNGWPSDSERVEAAIGLIDDGYDDQLLFSHDVCMKIQRQNYGGFGYSHLLENVKPLFQHHGVPSEVFEQIVVDNPQDVFAFAAPA